MAPTPQPRRSCRICSDPQRSGAPVSCAKCKLVFYCSRVHRSDDTASHTPHCQSLHALRQQLTKQERGLRGELREYVGLYWGFYEARDYLRTKMQIMELYAKLDSREALEKALDEASDLLRLSRADPLAVRYAVPALYLRLDKAQDCYDFVKWWALALSDPSYSFRDMEVPFLNLKGADMTEPLSFVDMLWLPHSLALVAIKLKVLRALWEGIQAERVCHAKLLPLAIGRKIQEYLGCPPTTPARSVHNVHHDVQAQVVELIKRTTDLNAHIWRMVLDPTHRRPGKRVPDGFAAGSKDEARVTLDMWLDLLQDTSGLEGAVVASGVIRPR